MTDQVRDYHLIIETEYVGTVKKLLVSYGLAEEAWFEIHEKDYLDIYYPEPQNRLPLSFWLGTAQTCGLIVRWISSPWMWIS